MGQESPQKAGGPSLPIIDCGGCGVCCFHMGYPAFILPREPLTEEEIARNPELAMKASRSPKFRQALLDGHPGEEFWHTLPADLKADWEAYVAQYQTPEYGVDPSSFDGPCIWLDLESRQCKHHQYRPRVCRDFETGSASCLEWRAFYKDKINK